MNNKDTHEAIPECVKGIETTIESIKSADKV